jgi:hypothetical protein
METPGSLMDKLFTTNHKLWNQEEIAQAPGADDHIVAEAKRKISKLNLQRNALIQEFDESLWGMFQELIRALGSIKNPCMVVPQFKDYSKREG